MKIYNLGSLNIDYVYAVEHFVTAGETLSSADMKIFPGGKGLNQSIAAARAGATVIHGAKLGENGQFLVDTLSESGVDTNRIERISGSCGHAIIQVEHSGENCILLFAGSNHCIDREYAENFLCDAQRDDILLLQNEVNGLDYIMELAHKKEMQIAFNPSPFSDKILNLPLSYVTWWFCNEIEGAALFGSGNPHTICQKFIEKYPHSNLILTLGKNGCIFANKEQTVSQPIYDANVVDTTAAGDTFTGYFLSAVISGNNIETALKLASKASSITISRQGASISIPHYSEVKI